MKPGGRFVFVELHPFVWMFDDDAKEITPSYFNTGVIEGQESRTYANRELVVALQYANWNHSLDEVLDSLKGVGLKWESFHEYDYSPHGFLPGSSQVGGREYILEKWGRKFPLVYSLICSKWK